ncbi:MAG: hypothetical protein ACRC1H_17750, partial [Caldilineaceae bacterium]
MTAQTDSSGARSSHTDTGFVSRPAPKDLASGPGDGLLLYMRRQAASLPRYLLEQVVFLMGAWVPTVVGIGWRALLYRLILRMEGIAAIENGVRLRYASGIRLGSGSYLDQGVDLHACPQGIEIGEQT